MLSKVLLQFKTLLRRKPVSKIFATSWQPGGINTIIPVIKKMQEDGKVEVIVMGHEFSEPILANAGITFKTINDFGVADISVDSMKTILQAVMPQLVLMGTSAQEGRADDVIEQTTTLAAKTLGIPTLAVLDTWLNYRVRFEDERTDQPFDFMPDCIAIMDRVAMEEMLAEGFPKEKLVITGNPHFDSLFAKGRAFSKAQKQAVRDEIGLPCDTLFFFATTIFSQHKSEFGHWDLDVINLIIKTLPKMSGVGVVVRLHPRTPAKDKEQISKAINESGVNIKLIDEIDSQTLILASDLTIVQNSTIGIEAVLMGKPVISLQPNLPGQDTLLVSKKDIVPVAFVPASCQALLVAATDSQYRKELLKKSASFSTDGKATERVIQLAYSLLSK